MGETVFDASDLAMVGASFVKRPFGGKVETVLTPATHRLLPRLFVLGFWARELDCFLLDLFVAGMRRYPGIRQRVRCELWRKCESWVSLRFD